MRILTAFKKHQLGAACLGAVALVLAVLGSVSWSISKERVDDYLRQALRNETAYSLVSFGSVKAQAFPWPRLEVADLKLQKETPSMEKLSVEKLRVRLNLASWLFGTPRLVEMRVVNPVVMLSSSEKLYETEAVSTIVLNFLRSNNRPYLRELRVLNAEVLMDGKPWIRQLHLNVKNVAATDLRLLARAHYKDIPITLISEIAQGTNPEGREIDWKLSLPGMTTSFDGRLFGSKSIDAEGLSKTVISDGTIHAGQFGLPLDLARMLNNLTLSGETKITWPTIQMRNANMQFDQNKLDGSVDIVFEGNKPRFSATLGADEIDLSKRFTAITNSVPEPSETWSDNALSLDWLSNANADIRLSIDRLLFGKTVLRRLALSSQIRDGRLEMLLSEALLKSGSMRGRATIRGTDQEISTRGSLQFDKIDLEDAQDLIGISRVKGVATGQVTFDAKGATPAELMRRNDGKGQVQIRNGEFVGLDLERLMTRLDRTTQAILTPSGSTRFRSMAGQFALRAGEISLSETSFSTLGLSAPVDGTINLYNQSFDLRLRLQPLIEIPRLAGAAIKITGPWNKPVFTPDMSRPPDRS
jgi:uncharacterized protein involved in outer membrane biogenesis